MARSFLFRPDLGRLVFTMPTPLVGLSAMALALPPFCVSLQDWCAWTGNDWSKVQAVVGQRFRIAGPQQNVYTLAATAVVRLIQQGKVDPARVGMLALGTESSTDNAVGAVIVRGLVDVALQRLGLPPLARSIEVPEYKHACLAGVYALKGALRWLLADGAGKQAIVVCGDLATYERGSSGEQTQGAGAVAMLVEANPQLLALDLRTTGSSSAYRVVDFRKPTRRWFVPDYPATAPGSQPHDYPVFNGKYSTTCYLDATLQALRDLHAKTGHEPAALYEDMAAILLHRPYQHMPLSGMASLWVQALALSPSKAAELQALAALAGVDPADIQADAEASPAVGPELTPADPALSLTDTEPYPALQKAVKALRQTPDYARIVQGKLQLGSKKASEFGNLYTASLPAWLAAALQEAAEGEADRTGERWLLIGYGSGDAAEAMVATIQPGWRAAAQQIGLDEALAGAIALTAEQYASLHAGQWPADLPEPALAFRIERTGDQNRRAFADVGIDYFAFAP